MDSLTLNGELLSPEQSQVLPVRNAIGMGNQLFTYFATRKLHIRGEDVDQEAVEPKRAKLRRVGRWFGDCRVDVGRGVSPQPHLQPQHHFITISFEYLKPSMLIWSLI